MSYNIKVNNLIFFGSRATGKFRKDSDVDFIVVSPVFKSLVSMAIKEWVEI